MVDYASYTTELYPFASLQVALAAPGEPAFVPPPESPDHGRRVAAYYWWLFPNLMLNFYPWGLSVNLVSPPGRTARASRSAAYVGDASLLPPARAARSTAWKPRTKRSSRGPARRARASAIAAAATRRRASAACITSTGCSREFL